MAKTTNRGAFGHFGYKIFAIVKNIFGKQKAAPHTTMQNPHLPWTFTSESYDDIAQIGNIFYDVDQADDTDLDAIEGTIDGIIDDAIGRHDLQDHDLMTVAMYSAANEMALVTSTPLTEVEDMNANVVMDVVQDAAQSARHVALSFSLAQVSVRFVRSPAGDGG